MRFRVVRRYQRGRVGNILRDDVVQMKSSASRRLYPAWMRRVVAMVEVDGKWREMTFLSDNLEWSAQTIVDLYRCRWGIELFFKEIKQTLQLADFLGHNANAVRWQIWTALLTYVLLRFCAWISRWGHSFTKHRTAATRRSRAPRSEEHTSELQSRQYLVCRLLLEKKKKKILQSNDREAVWAVEKAFGQVREARNPAREKDVAEMGYYLRKNLSRPVMTKRACHDFC